MDSSHRYGFPYHAAGTALGPDGGKARSALSGRGYRKIPGGRLLEFQRPLSATHDLRPELHPPRAFQWPPVFGGQFNYAIGRHRNSALRDIQAPDSRGRKQANHSAHSISAGPSELRPVAASFQASPIGRPLLGPSDSLSGRIGLVVVVSVGKDRHFVQKIGEPRGGSSPSRPFACRVIRSSASATAS